MPPSDWIATIGVFVAVVSLGLAILFRRLDGSRLRVSTGFEWAYLADRGGNNFALKVTATNHRRGKIQIIDWIIVSRRRRVGRERVGVRSSWNGGPIRNTFPLPYTMDGPSRATWTISLVDSPNVFPTFDDLVGLKARVEMEIGGRRRRVHSAWFEIPARPLRRSSEEIAASSDSASGGVVNGIPLASLLIDPSLIDSKGRFAGRRRGLRPADLVERLRSALARRRRGVGVQ